MRPNLAARAGRWSAAHWKTATFGWLLLVVAAVVLGSAVGTKKLADVEQANGETARAERMLVDAGIRRLRAKACSSSRLPRRRRRPHSDGR